MSAKPILFYYVSNEGKIAFPHAFILAAFPKVSFSTLDKFCMFCSNDSQYSGDLYVVRCWSSEPVIQTSLATNQIEFWEKHLTEERGHEYWHLQCFLQDNISWDQSVMKAAIQKLQSFLQDNPIWLLEAEE